MVQPHIPTRGRTPPPADSLGRVLAVSLALTLAIPAVLLAITHPGLAVAFTAGAASARVLAHPPAPIARAGRRLTPGRHARRPASK